MKENIVAVNFKMKSKVYHALSELQRDTADDNHAARQAQIVKNNDNEVEVKDGFASGITTTDDTLTGGSLDMIIGGDVDAGDAGMKKACLKRQESPS